MSKQKSARKNHKQIKPSPESKSSRFNFEKFVLYKHTGLIIAGLYLVVVGIISFVFHKVGDYGVETDFFWGYVPNAREFLSGKIPIDAFRGPLYPMFLGIAGFLTGDFFKAGILIGVLSAAVVIYVTFELLKTLFSPIISFIVTIFLAINPVFVQYSYSAGTDMFFNALVAVTLYFFFKKNELNYKNIILAAIFAGLSYLTRYNGIFLVSFVFVILFVNFWKINRIQRIKASVLFAIVFILTFSPWGLYCLSEKGSFFYNENYKNIAYEFYGKERMSWDEFWFKESKNFTSLAEVVFKNAGTFTEKILGNIKDHFSKDMDKLIGWHTGIFVVLGIFLFVISKPHKYLKSKEISRDLLFKRQVGYFITNIFFFALLLLVFYSERFSLFLIPFYLVIAVQPFFIEKLKLAKVIPKQLRNVLLAGLIVFTIADSFSFNSQNINSGPEELLVLQDWYFKHVPENERGKKVSSRKPHVAYYLDMDFFTLPLTDNYDELISKLRENNVDYLYFSTIDALARRQFQFLLESDKKHPGLEPVVYFNNPPTVAVLYKVIYK